MWRTEPRGAKIFLGGLLYIYFENQKSFWGALQLCFLLDKSTSDSWLLTHLLYRFRGTITVKPWPSGPMPRPGSPGSMPSWPSWRRKGGSTIWPDTPPRASWHVATSGSLGKTGWGSLMNCCWMLIGQLMLELGCGSPAPHFSHSFFQSMIQSNLAEK